MKQYSNLFFNLNLFNLECISERNNPCKSWFNILLHTQSIVCATVSGQCLEYTWYKYQNDLGIYAEYYGKWKRDCSENIQLSNNIQLLIENQCTFVIGMQNRFILNIVPILWHWHWIQGRRNRGMRQSPPILWPITVVPEVTLPQVKLFLQLHYFELGPKKLE